MIKKLLWVFGTLVALIFLACLGGYVYFIRVPLPTTEGEIRLASLNKPVEVLRDRWGVPHIYAESEHDLLVAQGYVQAQDRLWQMETNRRVAAGRLSEVIGPKTLNVDRMLRTLGIMRAAEREWASYSPEEKRLFSAFAKGVNAFIESRADSLPVEFRLLKVRPEPWHPVDSIAWAKVMALMGSKNWQEEIVRALLTDKLQDAKAQDLLQHLEWNSPVIVTSSLPRASSVAVPPAPVSHPLGQSSGASNSWAVHGSRTATGAPLLANDMHLPVAIPSVWYEMHLVGGPYDVIGLSLPGVPLVIAGHNRDVAWGITFAYTDIQDLYLEKRHPDHPGRYRFQGAWVPAQKITEQIRVKGRDEPVAHVVWETRHGPIISPQLVQSRWPEHEVSLRWSAHDPGKMGAILRDLNLSRDWIEFKSAASRWSEPAINLSYADRRGNIGYVLASRIPIRSQGHGMGPFPGWTGDHEWLGYVRPEEKPCLLNPAQGFVATANNRVTGEDYPYYISQDYAPGFRAARIEAFLEEHSPASLSDFQTLQGDYACLPAAPFLEAVQGADITDPEAAPLLDILNSWDGILDADSRGGAVYVVLYQRLMENTFRDELGDLTGSFFGLGSTPLLSLTRFVGHSRVILLNLMSDPRSPWFDNAGTSEREDLSAVLEQSLKETRAFLTERLGPDDDQWRWGRLHQAMMTHPLGQVKPLDRVFNRGPFEVGGHFATVWQSAVKPGMDFDLNGWTVSNRHIYDLKDWDRSLGAIVPGQSGMIGSPHYDDQVDLWLRVEHHPLHFTRSKVASSATETLVLSP